MSQSTLNQEENRGLFGLFKGESGTGKSTAALSWPGLYVFDFDKKMPGVAKKHYPRKEIHYDTFDYFEEVVQKLKEFHEYCPYETLLADSFTFLCSLTMNSVARVKGDSVPEMLQRVNEPVDIKKKKTGPKTIEPMSMEYYTGEVRFTEWFIDQLKALWARPGNPHHVIVTAHVLKVESAPNPFKDGAVTVTRDIVSKGRKAGQQLPAGFDDVYLFGYTQINPFDQESKPRRLCFTEAYGEDSAKCSLKIPTVLDFTNDSLYDKIFNRAEITGA